MRRNAVMSRQMPLEFPIMLEPPEGGFWEHQVLSTLAPQSLELGDSSKAIRRVMTRVGPFGSLRKMPSLTPLRFEQRTVTFADDQNLRSGRSMKPNCVPDAAPKLVVQALLRIRKCARHMQGKPSVFSS